MPLSVSRRLLSSSALLLRRSLTTKSTCRSQNQRLKEAVSSSAGTTNAIIHPHHIVESGVETVDIPDLTLDEYIWKDVSKWPNRIAMECALTKRSYTYGQCRLLTRRFASALIKSGLGYGDVVALVLPNIPEFPIAFLGANKAGCSVTLINPLYTVEEVAKQLSDAQVKTVVTISMFVPLVQGASRRIPNVKDVIVIGEAEEGCHSFMSMMKDDGSACPSERICDPKNDIAALPYSSGTTGQPKGVMLTHYNMIANICECIVPEWCNFHETTRDYQEVFGVVLPFFHIYSLNAILLGGLSVGAKIACLPKFEPNMYIKMLEEYKPNFLHTVPPLLNFLATNPDIKRNHLERVHTVISGGAPPGRVLIDKALDRFEDLTRDRPLFQEGFGMTESSPIITLNKVDPKIVRLGSCGTPVPMTQIAIIDNEKLESVGPNTTGELYCRGPQVMKGYLNNKEATQETMDGEWLRTGDVAYYDEEGNFYVVDRIKELIKVKGFQVAPSELEHIILKHPKVLDCAVVGVDCDMAGELPRAFIVPRPGTKISEAEIHSYMEQKVAPYKQLKGGVRIMEEGIPRNPGGKILRKDLKNL